MKGVSKSDTDTSNNVTTKHKKVNNSRLSNTIMRKMHNNYDIHIFEKYTG